MISYKRQRICAVGIALFLIITALGLPVFAEDPMQTLFSESFDGYSLDTALETATGGAWSFSAGKYASAVIASVNGNRCAVIRGFRADELLSYYETQQLYLCSASEAAEQIDRGIPLRLTCHAVGSPSLLQDQPCFLQYDQQTRKGSSVIAAQTPLTMTGFSQFLLSWDGGGVSEPQVAELTASSVQTVCGGEQTASPVNSGWNGILVSRTPLQIARKNGYRADAPSLLESAELEQIGVEMKGFGVEFVSVLKSCTSVTAYLNALKKGSMSASMLATLRAKAVPALQTALDNANYQFCLDNLSLRAPIPTELTVGPITYSVVAGKAKVISCDPAVEGELTLPADVEGAAVTAIAPLAFAGCRELTALALPETLTSVGKNAFLNAVSLAALTVDPDNPVLRSADGALYDRNSRSLLCCPEGKSGELCVEQGTETIAEGALMRCSALTEVILPDGLKQIRDNAFEHCSFLTSVTFPDTLTEIGNFAFFGCNSLRERLFSGTGEDWSRIAVGLGNSALTAAALRRIPTASLWLTADRDTVEEGDSFSVTATVHDLTSDRIGSAMVWVAFDPSVVCVADENGVPTEDPSRGLILPEQDFYRNGQGYACAVAPQISNTDGLLCYTFAKAPEATADGIPVSDGSYSFLTIRFRAIGEGDAGICLADPEQFPDEPIGRSAKLYADLPIRITDTVVPDISVEPFLLRGDVNFDGKINAADAILVLRHDASLITLNGRAFRAADVDGSGSADSADAILILRYDSGLQ